jgi:Domain of unknown function (DUF5664)
MQKNNDGYIVPPTTALKFDNDKPGMDLLPVEAKKAIAEVFDFGAKKYARHNWRNGFNYSRLIAACERHLDAFNDGENLDPESGKSHLAHAGCCLMMLLESTIKGYGTDNRHKDKQSEIAVGAWPSSGGVNEAAKQADDLTLAARQLEQVATDMKINQDRKSWLESKIKNGN